MSRKSDLLLLQNVIYGSLFTPAVVHYEFITESLTKDYGPAYSWYDDLLGFDDSPPSIYGTITDNTPIDVVSWSAQGVAHINNLAPWQLCGIVLSRL